MMQALTALDASALQGAAQPRGNDASILLIADAPTGADGRAAAMATGARWLGEVAWTDARLRLEQQGLVSVVLAETQGVADELLEQILPRLAAFAAGGGTRLVIALEPAQIDLVSATLGTAPVDLLCTASIGDRIAALSVALYQALPRLHDVGATNETARLMRLNEEIARIAETLTRLIRGDDDIGVRGVGEPGLSYRAVSTPARTEIRVREIRDAIRARRLRDQVFGPGLFEDPAWDMLLDLFAAELERVQVSVSSLCIAAAVAPTTALRWIARMTEAGLFERRPDPFDRRRAFMALSARASAGMRSYVDAVRQAGTGIA